jgi:hypothetical protein
MWWLEAALFATPYLLLIGLLAVGRFPGERALLARRVASPASARRATGRRWTRAVERALASQLERTSHRLRGPPVAA